MFTSIYTFFIVLGILVLFHEFGHFIAARLFGVGVEKFSLGFGPRLFGKKIGGTDYRVSAVPLGGYVKLTGDDPKVEVPERDIPLSFAHKHVLIRLLIVAAGPLFNLLLAVIIFFGVFHTAGVYILEPSVGRVGTNTPAERAGLKKDDLIIAMDRNDITRWSQLAEAVEKSRGGKITVSVLRDDILHDFEIVPEMKVTKNIFGEDVKRYLMGITASGKYHQKRLTVSESLLQSIDRTIGVIKLTLTGVAKIITGRVSAKAMGVGGPIMIAQMAGEQAQHGIINLIIFTALLSINLALLNFLPIPVLDGGHIAFFLIELIRGRPLSIEIREKAQRIGVSILICLMIYVFYSDIARIFS